MQSTPFRIFRAACRLTALAWVSLVVACVYISCTENCCCCWKSEFSDVSIFPLAEYLCPDEYGPALAEYQDYVRSMWPHTLLSKNQTLFDLDCFDTRPRHPWCIPPYPWLKVLASPACLGQTAPIVYQTCNECPAKEAPDLVFRVWNMLVPLVAFFWFLFASPMRYFYAATLVVSRVDISLSVLMGMVVFGIFAKDVVLETRE